MMMSMSVMAETVVVSSMTPPMSVMAVDLTIVVMSPTLAVVVKLLLIRVTLKTPLVVILTQPVNLQVAVNPPRIAQAPMVRKMHLEMEKLLQLQVTPRRKRLM